MKETTKTYRRKSVIRRLDTVENKINVLLIATVLFVLYRLSDFILFVLK